MNTCQLISPQNISSQDFFAILQKSPKTLLYFYPKDNTPGCTTEAKDFTEFKTDFEKLGIQIIGVSKDSEKSHQNFIAKQDLNIDLISDPDLELHKKYGARGEKKNYGKTYMGTIRSTFLLDQNGEVLQSRINVRAKGHAQRVLNELD